MLNVVLLDIGIPSSASAVQRITIDQSRDFSLTLEELESEAFRCVPCDVAMHEPSLESSSVKYSNTQKAKHGKK